MPDDAMTGTEVYRGTVLPEWIDVNQHMNVAYYVLAFDYGVDSIWERIGMTDDLRDATGSSTFAVESHVTWQRELALDEPYVITTQVLAFDQKRIHQFMRMYHATEKYLAATCEWMNLHVNLAVRRVAPWPEPVQARIAEFCRTQQDCHWPAEAGSRMQVKAPIYDIRNES